MDNPIPTLEEAFAFTPQDLEFNRVGHLSEPQIQAVRGGARRIAAAVLAALLALGLLTIWSTQVDSDELPVFLLAIVIPAAVTLWFTIGTAERALGSGVVEKTSGTAYLAYGMLPFTPMLEDNPPQYRVINDPDGQKRKPTSNARKGRMLTRTKGTYVLRVGEHEFRLTREQYRAIQPGTLVNAYYLPAIHKVVSIEIIANERYVPEPTEELSALIAPPTYVPEPEGETLRA